MPQGGRAAGQSVLPHQFGNPLPLVAGILAEKTRSPVSFAHRATGPPANRCCRTSLETRSRWSLVFLPRKHEAWCHLHTGRQGRRPIGAAAPTWKPAPAGRWYSCRENTKPGVICTQGGRAAGDSRGDSTARLVPKGVAPLNASRPSGAHGSIPRPEGADERSPGQRPGDQAATYNRILAPHTTQALKGRPNTIQHARHSVTAAMRCGDYSPRAPR